MRTTITQTVRKLNLLTDDEYRQFYALIIGFLFVQVNDSIWNRALDCARECWNDLNKEREIGGG